MNERIRELAEQSDMTQYVAAENKYLERFAKLIIRECCKVSDDIEPLELPHKTSKFIKLHFGVEE